MTLELNLIVNPILAVGITEYGTHAVMIAKKVPTVLAKWFVGKEVKILYCKATKIDAIVASMTLSKGTWSIELVAIAIKCKLFLLLRPSLFPSFR
jgi:hypothetical protein